MEEHDPIARAASGRGEVVLRSRRGDGALELRVNGLFVMDTEHTATEEALARSALARHRDPATVLVGGLGLGFTTRAVLADDRVQQVTVVEVEEAVVGWLRDGTVPHGPALLADDRLRVVTADIRVAVAEARPETYDVVLLDVDNGPGFLVYEANSAVYGSDFLGAVRRVLRPGGVVVVWSADEAPALHAALVTAFGSAAAQPHPVRLQDRDETYWLYLAARPPKASGAAGETGTAAIADRADG